MAAKSCTIIRALYVQHVNAMAKITLGVGFPFFIKNGKIAALQQKQIPNLKLNTNASYQIYIHMPGISIPKNSFIIFSYTLYNTINSRS